jgi:hypothetical protein
MVKRKFGMLLFLSILLFSECATTPAPKPGAAAQTVVTFQRRPSRAYADRIMQVFINDAAIPYSIENGGSTAVSVAHGLHYVYVKIGDARSDMVSFTASHAPLSFVVSVEKGLFRKPTVIIAKSAAVDTSAVIPPNAVTPSPAAPAADNAAAPIEKALNRAAETLMKSIQKQLKLAIANVSAGEQHKNLSLLVAGRLELLLVKNGYTVVDRSELDRIRDEQKFQLSGAVDDGQIVSIGKFAGADVIITGALTESGGARTLRLRAINIETAQVLAAAAERF